MWPFLKICRRVNEENMKPFLVSSFRALTLVCLFILCAAIQGCSKKGDVNVVLDTGTFSSASPELKNKWTAAAQHSASKNYLGTATNLIEIFGKSQELNAAQVEALNDAWVKLSNQAFAAANAGDKNATEAVLKMKESGVGDRRGR